LPAFLLCSSRALQSLPAGDLPSFQPGALRQPDGFLRIRQILPSLARDLPRASDGDCSTGMGQVCIYAARGTPAGEDLSQLSREDRRTPRAGSSRRGRQASRRDGVECSAECGRFLEGSRNIEARNWEAETRREGSPDQRRTIQGTLRGHLRCRLHLRSVGKDHLLEPGCRTTHRVPARGGAGIVP
jgi:hypothetical protein